MKHVVESYENYKEEDRLKSNNARRIEFITSMRAIKESIPKDSKVLDCAAGTGIYAFELARDGHDVTALDLTPRHVEVMRKELKSCELTMSVDVNDATDLSRFESESFDVVLCMGPMYHLIDEKMRDKCLKECTRVLRTGGKLVVAYISRYAVFPYISIRDKKNIKIELANKLIETGVIRSDDPDCFWTDCFFSTPDEVESDLLKNNLVIEDHLAADGISPILSENVDNMTEDEFKIWCDYHYFICREKSILGMSNHGLLIAKKVSIKGIMNIS